MLPSGRPLLVGSCPIIADSFFDVLKIILGLSQFGEAVLRLGHSFDERVLEASPGDAADAIDESQIKGLIEGVAG